MGHHQQTMFSNNYNSDNVLDLSLWKCEVCADLAHGKHYRVLCCDGCKGFFKRNHTKVEELNCINGTNSCDVDRRSRTLCKGCRLRKCFDVGMKLGGSTFYNATNSSCQDYSRTYTYEFHGKVDNNSNNKRIKNLQDLLYFYVEIFYLM